MRRQRLVLWIILFFLPISHAQEKAPPYPPINLSKQQAHRVIRVVDGDTFLVDFDSAEEKVRLIGVDTPETVHPSKPVQEYGKEASRFTKNLLIGEDVYLVFEKGSLSRDKYQRLLAYVFHAPDGLFVNLEMIRQGYAHAYTRFPFQHMELFRFYERKARESGKGLWGETNNEKPTSTTANEENNAPEASKASSQETEQVEKQEQTVYVTKSGRRYHKEGCSGLSKSKIPVSLTEAKKKYAPCPQCKPSR